MEETKMYDLALKQITEKQSQMLQVNVDNIESDILESFDSACTMNHYVILCEVNLNNYFTSEERQSFTRQGYYRNTDPNRFSNIFYIPQQSIKSISDILSGNEGMAVASYTDTKEQNRIYVVTLNGVKSSFFNAEMNADGRFVENTD